MQPPAWTFATQLTCRTVPQHGRRQRRAGNAEADRRWVGVLHVSAHADLRHSPPRTRLRVRVRGWRHSCAETKALQFWAQRNKPAAFCAPCASRLTAVQQSATMTPCTAEPRPRARRGRCWAWHEHAGCTISIARCWGNARAENNNLAHSRRGPDQVEQHVSVKKISALAPAFCRCCGAARGTVRGTSIMAGGH